MPIAVATQEAEIRRTIVQSQLEANSSRDSTGKKLSQKRAGGLAQGAGPEFKPQYCKKKIVIIII
jgi:hypothetical protein